jgi:dihydropteroate synthase
MRPYDPFGDLGTGKVAGAATGWRIRTRRIEFGQLPRIMGIVNVTPDSFSDGGRHFTPSQAVEHALRLVEDGADILDIGGESTRPYSQPIPEEEELTRVIPVIEALVKRVMTPISIDTSKSAVAAAALEAGAEIINDVTGLEGDPQMPDVAMRFRAGVCAMHMQGTPQTMQDDPHYENIVADIYGYLRQRDEALQSMGISADHICLDPGIGFGKTHEHNITLLQNCEKFMQLGRPILIGHSRKGFIGKIVGDKGGDRSAGSVGVSLALALKSIPILRVHDVRSTRHALQCFLACFENPVGL